MTAKTAFVTGATSGFGRAIAEHLLRDSWHVVVTGRGCPPALLDAADLVTEMTKVRHPFDRGQKGQRGIEW